jgi:protein-S-isoprenylcysteine O-methyltransferase Ste14
MSIYNEHCILSALWLLFCAVHHFTATEKCKNVFSLLLGRQFRYYRVMYSFLALINLVLVLWYQFSIRSIKLDYSSQVKYFVGLPFGLIGAYLMCVSMQKYFFKLSGISVFYVVHQPISLEITGIHKFVRHPLYLGTLLFAWSLLLFFPLLTNLIACCVMTSYILIGIRSEEKKLMNIFGGLYKDYCCKTPALIPHIRVK